MSEEPICLALREISETKRLLETVVISSESFDYLKAKSALLELDEKVRTLGQLQVALLQRLPQPQDCVIPFPGREPSGNPVS